MTDTYRYTNADARVSVTTNVVVNEGEYTTRPYVQLHNDIRSRTDLTPTAKIIFAAIHQYQLKSGVAWPAYSRLARENGMSKRAVIYAIELLTAKGLISKNPQFAPNKSQQSNFYRLPEGDAKIAPGGDANFATKENNTTNTSLRSVLVGKRTPGRAGPERPDPPAQQPSNQSKQPRQSGLLERPATPVACEPPAKQARAVEAHSAPRPVRGTAGGTAPKNASDDSNPEVEALLDSAIAFLAPLAKQYGFIAFGTSRSDRLTIAPKLLQKLAVKSLTLADFEALYPTFAAGIADAYSKGWHAVDPCKVFTLTRLDLYADLVLELQPSKMEKLQTLWDKVRPQPAPQGREWRWDNQEGLNLAFRSLDPVESWHAVAR